MQGKEVAKAYYHSDLNPVPLRDKVPIREGWGNPITLSEIESYDFKEIGICTGVVSGGLEMIDFDIDRKPKEEQDEIMREYQKKVGGDLIAKLVIQQTKNGGFHLFYRCSEIEGNKVLARDKDGEVLIETRGDGGYAKCYPSVGYKLIRGSFEDIPIISPIERNKLFSAAFRFDEESFVKHRNKRSSEEFSKFPKYDNDPNIGIELLEKHGWTILSEDKEWVEMTRPGKTHGVSGGYNLEKNFFYVHTTSTKFKDKTPYNNVGIFAVLECEGDFRVAYARLAEKGYGSHKSKKKHQEQDAVEGDLELMLESLSFVSSREDEADYLKQAAENKIEQGLSTGWASLDEYFRLKRNSLNVGLGYDGVGKSVWMTSFSVASNVLHDWKWGMVMPENKTAMNRRRLIEAYSGQTIKFLGKNPKMLEKYKQFAYDNFHIVNNKKHWSLKEVILLGKRLYEYYGIDALLIDPYNFFKVGSDNGYSWNNEILSELRVFAEEYCAVYMMAHPSSESPRKNKDGDGYLLPPKSYEIQGGADFPYRVDDFFVVHRVKNHEEEDVRKTMQFISHKIKETETGGRVHPLGEYTALEWDVRDNFMGYWDSRGNNPMYEWRKEQGWHKEEKWFRVKEEEENNELFKHI